MMFFKLFQKSRDLVFQIDTVLIRITKNKKHKQIRIEDRKLFQTLSWPKKTTTKTRKVRPRPRITPTTTSLKNTSKKNGNKNPRKCSSRPSKMDLNVKTKAETSRAPKFHKSEPTLRVVGGLLVGSMAIQSTCPSNYLSRRSHRGSAATTARLARAKQPRIILNFGHRSRHTKPQRRKKGGIHGR